MRIPVKCGENFLETELDGEILLVDLEGGELMSMTGTARAIWQLVDGRRTEGEIVAELEATYDGVSGPDVSEYIATLERAALVTFRGRG